MNIKLKDPCDVTHHTMTINNLFHWTVFIAVCGWCAVTSAESMNKTMQEAYLKRFHHLGVMNPDPRMADLQSDPDGQFRMAVSSFQRFAGLPMTGEVDGETMNMMQMRRCGVADLQSNMGGVARRRRRRYTTISDPWQKTALTYRFPSGYTSDLSREVTKREIAKAFQVWSNASPLTFTESDQLSDIEITFADINHGDNAPFDGPGGVLAHAYPPGLGIGGDVHFDESESFTSETNQGTNLLQVAIHELGHSLGLGHSENQAAIMAPFYRGYVRNVELDNDDIKGIQYLYGRKPLSPGPKATTIAPPRPTVDTKTSVSAFCRDPVFDAIDIINGKIHVFYGDNYIELDENGQIRPEFPKPIAETFPGLPGSLDAVLSLESIIPGGLVYFFKGTSYYTFDKSKPREIRGPFPIRDTFSNNGGISSVDAAFVWSGNGQIYFIKGNYTHRYYLSSGRGYTYSPRPLSEWKGLPSSINDAFQHTSTGRTYFFGGKQLYNFNDKDFKVQFIEDTYKWMGCCDVRVKELEMMYQLVNTARVINPSFITTTVAAAALAFYYVFLHNK